MVSINSNKYSVPVKYVGKTVQFRIVYGFRIEIYDSRGSLILRKEAGDGTHLRVIDAEHYEPIAKKVPTSIPQIRRDFTKLFTNGALYLAEAAKKYDQPTHYARKIMDLRELYDDDVLDVFIGEAVKKGRFDIKSFRAMLKEHNRKDGARPQEGCMQSGKADEGLTRNCDYYEQVIREGAV